MMLMSHPCIGTAASLSSPRRNHPELKNKNEWGERKRERKKERKTERKRKTETKKDRYKERKINNNN